MLSPSAEILRVGAETFTWCRIPVVQDDEANRWGLNLLGS